MESLAADVEIREDGSIMLLSPLPGGLQPGKARVWLLWEQQGGDLAVVPRAGSLKGFKMAPDFDEPLEDFREYME